MRVRSVQQQLCVGAVLMCCFQCVRSADPQVNEGFATLAEVLHLQRKTKADKVTVLQSAIAEIRVRPFPPPTAMFLVCGS